MTVYGEDSRTPAQRREFGEVGVLEVRDLAPIGNVCISAGKTIPSTEGTGWEQVAYVVLTPEEWRAFVIEVDTRLLARAERIAAATKHQASMVPPD